MPTFKHPCPHCGTYIARDAVACPKCGTKDPFAPARCGSCGTVIEDPSHVACARCGKPVGAAAVAAEAEARARAGAQAGGNDQPRPGGAVGHVTPDTEPPAGTDPLPGGKACAACGSPLAIGAGFCRDCGTPVGSS